MTASRRPTWIAFILFLLAVAVRVGIADRQGIWADEAFSLAIATGHSLEQPAEQSDVSRGDFVETTKPIAAEQMAAYLEHDAPAASVARVLRAVLLSDTSPPLYYLGLWAWTLAAGTSDWSLRLFSVFWAAACFPLLWSIARQLGGKRTAIVAGILFTFSPLCVFYSIEGRMYSMFWFFVLASAWLTLRLNRQGVNWPTLVLWIVSAACGLLTHYFFAFVLAAMAGWLLICPGQLKRWMLVIASMAVGVMVLPWYVKLPASLGAWRITSGWLEIRPDGYGRFKSFWELTFSYLSPAGVWGGWDGRWLKVAQVLFAVVVIVVLVRGRLRRLVSSRTWMIWMWLAAALLGPVVFDQLKHTYTIAVSRYAIAGLPAAILLLSVGIGSLRKPLWWACIVLMLVAWAPALRRIRGNEGRINEPWRQVGEMVNNLTRGKSSVVIIHSIPSGAAGISRYLRPEQPVADWVHQLGTRQLPENALSLTEGFDRVVLVVNHEVYAPVPEKAWFDAHLKPAGTLQRETAKIYLYDVPATISTTKATSQPAK